MIRIADSNFFTDGARVFEDVRGELITVLVKPAAQESHGNGDPQVILFSPPSEANVVDYLNRDDGGRLATRDEVVAVLRAANKSSQVPDADGKHGAIPYPEAEGPEWNAAPQLPPKVEG